MKRSTRKQLPSLVASGVALALCVSGLGYAAFQAYGKVTPDKFGCFENVSQRQTLALFDASEPRFTEEQARSLRRYLDYLYLGLAFNERLSVVTSESDQIGSVMRSRFHVCGQASRPEELEAINAPAADPGYLQKQRARLYERVLGPQLDALLSANPDERRRQLYQSPVLEMIADLSRRRLKPSDRLIVISDLIQNSDSARFCRVKGDMPRFSSFAQRESYRERLAPQSLEGVTVEVLMIQRSGYGRPQGLPYCYSEEEIRAFWRDYFTTNGVKDLRFIRIRLGTAEG